MLGRFLELALVSPDPGAAWQNYQALGFAPAETGDVWPHAYGVVTCEGLALGMHGRGDEPISVVFVKPGVAALHRELVARGVQIEQARLGPDVFNELWLREPGGMALRVLESRTWSPPLDQPSSTALGMFQVLSLPVRDLEGAREFWHRIGHETETLETIGEGFRVAGTPVAVHSRREFGEPLAVFRQPAPPLESILNAGALVPERLPARFSAGAQLLRTADDMAVLLLP